MVDDLTLDEVVTPALVVDRARVLANVDEMAARARSLGVGLRPHAKTHKSPVIAAHQRAHGALGLTVATMPEAEGFADEGIDDLVLSAPPVGDWRLQRLVSLARRVRLRVAVDDPEVVAALERACARAGVRVGYLWELDCGVGRFGTPPGRATAERIASVADTTTHCSFDGLFTFGGHVYRAANRADLEAAARDEADAIAETASALADYGIEAQVRSVGSTPTAHVMRDGEGITEIRPGNYVFYDATQVALGIVGLERCALSVLTTVSSRPARDRLIIDAGSKALAADAVPPPGAGFGRVVGHPELTVVQLYEEQGIVTSARPCEIPTGTRLRVVPNHACAAVNLHDRMLVTDGGAIVDRWPVAFRGWRERGGDREPAGLGGPQS